jgi:hypothetical protein
MELMREQYRRRSEPMTLENFNVLKRFVGFGNPDGMYWFIGIEEAGEWDDEYIEDVERYKKQIIAIEPGEMEKSEEKTKAKGKRFTRIYDYMSYFVLASSSKAADALACRKYSNEELLQTRSETFQANLYPLGKRSLSHWDHKCVELTGYESKREYYRNVENDRFLLLREKWNHYKPSITMCFGASHWDKFEKLLDLQGTNYKNRDWYRVYDSRIILCPFFIGHKMKNDYKEKLAKEIQTLLSE